MLPAEEAAMPTVKRRRRVPPRQRFAGTERVFNLRKAFAQLPRESTPRQGHMQKALYRLGPTTTAIFAFKKDGRIDHHVFDGEAIIQVLRGRISVCTKHKRHLLKTNELMMLDPGVPHDFKALRPTRLLVTFVQR
jgi:quercetin dioxygenase-like cupin family protein